ncbi:MAG: hypothetical protein LBV27_02260 [Oscillospiraceae bacterium]|jgi:hypothetical protein|nr:hypothetical protein [Oscillospiraceae bacterium]
MAANLYKMIRRANDLIGDRTPIRADCGRLCAAACCQGDDYGMLLFPGEAARLANIPGFKVSRFRYMGSRAWLLSCPGTCNRAYRPLSCRIFPLAPHISANGAVSALPDPRGRRMCPLWDGRHLDSGFRKAVERALGYLGHDPAMLGFMRLISEELDDLRKLV